MICLSHDNACLSVVRALPLCVAALMLAMPAAHAADWPGDAPLRGTFDPPAPASSGVRWDGFVLGGSIGAFNLNADFTSVTFPVATDTLPANKSSAGKSFGGFVGYNSQWDDVIIGVDLGYNKLSGGEAAVSSTRTVVGATSTLASSSIKLNDYGTLRARAGFMVGQFAPYVAAGVAVGRFDYMNSTTITDLLGVSAPISTNDGRNGTYVGGFVGGLGVDVAITSNIFLRAEWEYAAFGKVHGISTGMNTGRVAVGARF